jgi:hypothetical protein
VVNVSLLKSESGLLHNKAMTVKTKLFAGLAILWLIGCGPEAGAASSNLIGLLENPRDSSSLRVNTDLFVRPNLSVGAAAPIIPDPAKSWQTVQAKAWFNLPAVETSSRLFLQSGVGFLQVDPLLTPERPPWTMPSLMVPFGIGMDYPSETGRILTTTLSLNLSDLRAGSSPSTHLMPGLVFGIRF